MYIIIKPKGGNFFFATQSYKMVLHINVRVLGVFFFFVYFRGRLSGGDKKNMA